MIVHLIEDEKVVDRLIDNFENVCPGDNIYVCMCRKSVKGSYTTVHIHTQIPIHYFDYRFDSFDGDLSKCNLVIIHYLTYQKALFVNKYVPKTVRVCWSIWGGDLFGLLHDNYGYKLYSPENSYHKKITAKYLFKLLTGVEYNRNREIKRFIRNRVGGIIGTEADRLLLESYLGLSALKRFDYYYYSLEQILNVELLASTVSSGSKKILCGNSASFTGNHKYILNIIKGIDIKGWSVIMPLSYGGSSSYVDEIAQYGVECFGNSFTALKTFMPLSDYNHLMQSSPICIYGHWREEAFGNIVIALYLGSKVFLSVKNPYLKGLRELGFIVFELESISREDIERPMLESDRNLNRTKCIDLFSINKTQSYIDRIINNKTL